VSSRLVERMAAGCASTEPVYVQYKFINYFAIILFLWSYNKCDRYFISNVNVHVILSVCALKFITIEHKLKTILHVNVEIDKASTQHAYLICLWHLILQKTIYMFVNAKYSFCNIISRLTDLAITAPFHLWI